MLGKKYVEAWQAALAIKDAQDEAVKQEQAKMIEARRRLKEEKKRRDKEKAQKELRSEVLKLIAWIIDDHCNRGRQVQARPCATPA